MQRLIVGMFEGRDEGQAAFDMFVLFDLNKSGSVSRAECVQGLMRLGILYHNFETADGTLIRYAHTSLGLFEADNPLRKYWGRYLTWDVGETWGA